MSSPVESWIPVQLVATANTPTNLTQWNNKVVLLPPEYQPRMGSGPQSPGSLGQILGYAQAGGPTGTQFVMEPPSDMGLEDMTGAAGWASPAARSVYRNAAQTLVRDYGWTLPDARALLRALYDAAVLNYRTRIGDV